MSSYTQSFALVLLVTTNCLLLLLLAGGWNHLNTNHETLERELRALQSRSGALAVADSSGEKRYLAPFNSFLTYPTCIVGDGVADDTVAIQAALDDAGDSSSTAPGGATVVLPAGTMKITSSLQFATRTCSEGKWL